MSSDDVSDLYLANWRASQSLWNRAVSSDITPLLMLVIVVYVSIPLEQGSVFRHNAPHGNVQITGLNPFGTGQCLPTSALLSNSMINKGLNPFGTGQCLPT